MRIAQQEKTPILFNPTPAVRGLPREFFELSDTVVLNETELEIFTGRTVSNISEAREAAPLLLDMGANSVVVTLGAEGAHYFSKSEDFAVAGEKVKAVDTTGAGDSFIGALAHFLTQGKPMRDALTRANRIAAVSVQKRGTQSSYPGLKDLSRELLQ